MPIPKKKRFAIILELPAKEAGSGQVAWNHRRGVFWKTLLMIVLAASSSGVFWLRGGCQYGLEGTAEKRPVETVNNK